MNATMKWTETNDEDIRQKGFTILPGRIDVDLVEKALRLINRDFETSKPEKGEAWNRCAQDTFCPDLVKSGRLHFLATDTGALDFAEEGIGPLGSDLKAQIARRDKGDSGTPHIDGFYPKDDGNDVNTPCAVLGIYLTDVTSREDGAFTVWPEARPNVVEWVGNATETPKHDGKVPDFNVEGEGLPLLGCKGTAFLAHGTLPHCNAKRTVEPGYRDAVFFRLYCTNRDVLDLLKSGGTGW